MTPRPPYSYSASTKSAVSDELINTYAIRPMAGLIVRLLYGTPITPNGVTALSIIAGCCAAFLYATGSPEYTIVAGLCVTLKDVLDAADGQLARAKQLFSRKGRFFDSIGDFVVDLLVFAALGWAFVRLTGRAEFVPAALLGFLGTTLRVSYHVFYQTSYLHLKGSYSVNRITEDVKLFILMLFSVLGRLDIYLAVNLVVLNVLWGVSVAYRRWVLPTKAIQN
jgi:phosphatidylglycerophosphate synthase